MKLCCLWREGFSGSVWQNTNSTSARFPLVANILVPLITHWSPSLTAVVTAPVTSHPASGSVMAVPIMASPATSFGNSVSFCSCV
ncbi:MAG: hypothetical protein JRF60_01955, partial [Deltaproteobacteria bacterium]|nr:hypothetical protein [Deltaproteobacteria bacterium]